VITEQFTQAVVRPTSLWHQPDMFSTGIQNVRLSDYTSKWLLAWLRSLGSTPDASEEKPKHDAYVHPRHIDEVDSHLMSFVLALTRPKFPEYSKR